MKLLALVNCIISMRRSPCGERGLKCQYMYTTPIVPTSLPVRGAWVEISMSDRFARRAKSLPVRGAWVEMVDAVKAGFTGFRRSPCGERGLKSRDVQIVSVDGRVAPRAGSVG